MNKKNLIENLAKRVKTLVVESTLNENIKQDTYNEIMEYRIATNNLETTPTFIDLNRAEFYTYYKKWEESTILLESLHKIVESPYYNAIIKMGKRAIPYILECIKKNPDIIVLSLEEILGYSILPKNQKIIDIEKQCEIWKNYFKKNNTVLSTEIVS